MKKRKVGRRIAVFLAALLVFLFINNTSIFSGNGTGSPKFLAHRGVAQTFDMAGITNETCTAERIYPPEHGYLENTIPSMEAAFKDGADVVELDIHPTKDGEFAVFHDWELDCRTNGSGVTRDFTMEELKKLDIGYGYTADHGKTFPFRGKGNGLMPSLDEVLNQFPDKELLIHIKSNDPEEGEMLADYLGNFPNDRLGKLSVYGGDEPIASLKEELPDLRVMSKATMKSCLLPYMAVGWTGYVPKTCERTQVHIPEKIAPWLWGWPAKFSSRIEDAGTRVILVAGDGGFSEGFDSKEDMERIPDGFPGLIWTNRIDRVSKEISK
ncbi:glycerophosphodiester phosphodiesterase [Neobacillus piezotolerans]|uniref:Glycerophosphodiester phosphodiesterase n=1 Tax=Neobacillus piezotolerans TaxID=2259171 RepID=A0A3D8GNN4_9BACI|nr:glycerophosphodiester phosphodiesterase family protein [Neobacillus piezotolerans]RDU36090.1 glycerophosphodiester phosphodiesterase [Neobacillus piezotolerans]